MCLLDDKLNIVNTRLIKPKKLRGVERLSLIKSEIMEFTNAIGDIDELMSSREGYSYKSKGAAVFQLGELGGIVDVSIYEMDNEISHHKHYQIPPNTHKLFCILDGAATKGTLKQHKLAYLAKIEEHTGEQFDDDNIADAYMIARTLRGYHHCLTDEDFFNSLCRRKKNAFPPTSEYKKRKLTPVRVDQMDYSSYVDLVSETFEDKYLLFEK